MQELVIDEPLKKPNSSKSFCNKYNDYLHSHEITGRSFFNAYPKAQSFEKRNKSILKKLVKKYKLVLINSLRGYQRPKAFRKTIFSERKGFENSKYNNVLIGKVHFQ